LVTGFALLIHPVSTTLPALSTILKEKEQSPVLALSVSRYSLVITLVSETTSFEAKPLPAKATQANALNKNFLIFLLRLMMLPTEIFKSLWQLTPTAFLLFRKLKTAQ